MSSWIHSCLRSWGCFYIKIRLSTSHKLGTQVNFNFTITQHVRDKELLDSIVTYLGCGIVQPNSSAFNFIATKILARRANISEKIIPFFDTYPLQGVKSLDYADFRKAAEIMKVKGHLTKEGIDQIRFIKSLMNRGRSS